MPRAAKHIYNLIFLGMWLAGTLTATLYAQSASGTLLGVVQDLKGARVPAAKVSLQPASGAAGERTAECDSHGGFRVDNVLPGDYQVTITAPGFAPAHSSVSVVVGSAREIRVVLKPAIVEQTIQVQGGASSITSAPMDITSTVHQGAVTPRDLATIPLAHRSFANIAYLLPGTEPVEPSDPTKARITAVSFGGSSGLNVQLSVDGGDNSDDYIGGFLQNFSPDAIQEFVVRTAGQDADTGRTTAGSVVVTTKRVSNDWHGGLAFYERAAALNARFPIDNPAPEPKQPFSRQNYVAMLGGPIQKDKLWFFSSFEGVHENASIAYSPASLAQFNALATLAGQGLISGVSSIAVPANVPVPFRDYLGMLRVDWTQSQNSQWFLRVASDDYTTQNDLVQQATLPSTGATARSNYLNLVLSQQTIFSPDWLGNFTFAAGGLHHTEARNSSLGFALAFPFSSTASTISGFETFGDNQFVTPIAAFPVVRNQQKYEFRYDVSHASGDHAPRFGIDFIHEPVLSGALPGSAETLHVFTMNPEFYLANPAQFVADFNCTAAALPNTLCSTNSARNGSFSQNVQRLGMYAEDTWRVTPQLTVNYGLRYDTTFGLFEASGRSQLQNPALLTLQALHLPLVNGAPHDYRKAFAPRLGIAFSPEKNGNTVLRLGAGMYYDDLAQTGWVTAFQAVNSTSPACAAPPFGVGCIAPGGAGALIDPNYKTPYAFDATAGLQHAFSSDWMASADYTHQQGVHGYRRYQYEAGISLPAAAPGLTLFRSDNRSSYNALALHLQGNVTRWFNLVANYTLSSAKTWGCVLGELFDYVNGVCNPLHAFAAGDYGPSGEDARHRIVLAGVFHTPGGFELSTLTQAESARPFTLTTPVDVNGTGNLADQRAVINGVQTTLDEFRGTPYFQVDMRVSRPIKFKERWTLLPFVEFFNLLNRNNPGANYVTSLAALPVPVNRLSNATAFCLNAACTASQPITSVNQLRFPAGALGDFFGPGTTVGLPFAAQIGVRATF